MMARCPPEDPGSYVLPESFFPPLVPAKVLTQILTLIAMARVGGGWGEISYWPDLGQVLTFGDVSYRNLINYRWVGQNKGGGMMSRQNKR